MKTVLIGLVSVWLGVCCLAGDGVVLDGKKRMLFMCKGLETTAGTIEVVFEPGDKQVAEVVPLVSLGANDPVWWLLTWEGKKLGWLMENHGKMKLPGQYYERVDHVLKEEPTGALGVAVTWVRRPEGKSSVAMYVNGVKVAARDNVVLPPKLGNVRHIGAGTNTADAKAASAVGTVRGFRVTNAALDAESIAQYFSAVVNSGTVIEHDATLIDVYTDGADDDE